MGLAPAAADADSYSCSCGNGCCGGDEDGGEAVMARMKSPQTIRGILDRREHRQ